MIHEHYTQGRQPCQEFRPQRERNSYAEWDNEHTCFGPYAADRVPRSCESLVSFCENCHCDHHKHGWEWCGKTEEYDLEHDPLDE